MAPEQTIPTSAPAIKVKMIPLFPSWVYHCHDGPRHLNTRLEELAHKLMTDNRNAGQRTNYGGWHYAFDCFKLSEPVVAEFRDVMEQHIQGYLNHFRPEERKKKNSFRLEGWMNVNRQGDFNVRHCHPGCFLSATYYVRVPEGMKGGEIIFHDPRGPVVAMYETPAIELPWVGTGLGVPFAPGSGHLLIFPSWLEHRVEPFQGDGERISIAFNAVNPEP